MYPWLFKASKLARRKFSRTHLEAAALRLQVETGEMFQRIRCVADLQTRIYAVEEKMEENVAELLFGEKPLASRVLDNYFAAREELGLCDSLVAKTLDLLRRFYAFKGEHSPSKDDISLEELLLSTPFTRLIDDVRSLLALEHESRTEFIAQIFEALTALGLKSRGLIELAVSKAFRELSRYDEHLISETFRAELRTLMILPDQKPQSASEDELDRFGQIADEAGQISAEFLQAVTALRQNYFTLKTGSRREFLNANPVQLLDFLLLEEKLIALGLLMPHDLIAEENSAQFNELAGQQAALGAGFDPTLMTRLAERPLIDKVIPKLEELERSRKVFAEESALLLLSTALQMLVTPIVSSPPEDDLCDTRFSSLFAPVTEQLEEKKLHGLDFNQRKALEIYQLQGKTTPAFYFSYSFKTVRLLVQSLLSATDPSNFSPLARFIIATCLRLLQLDAQSFEKNLETVTQFPPVGLEGFKSVVILAPFACSSFFSCFVRSKGMDLQLKAAAEAWNTFGLTLNYKADLLYFIEAAKLLVPECKKMTEPLFQSAIAPGSLEAFVSLYRRKIIPFDRTLTSAWLFLNNNKEELIGRTGGVKEFDRVNAALRLFFDFEMSMEQNRDPVRFFLRKVLRKEIDWVLSVEELQLRDEVPNYWMPDLVLETVGNTRALYLCSPDRNSDSVDCQLRCSLAKGSEVIILPLEVLMADKEYFISFDFALQKDKKLLQSFFAQLLPQEFVAEELWEKLEILIKGADSATKDVLEGVRRLLQNAPENQKLFSAVAIRLTQWETINVSQKEALENFALCCQKKAQILPNSKTSTSVFSGRRFGKELLNREPSLAELANPSLLVQSNYLLFNSSEEESKRLSVHDFQRIEGFLNGRYGRVERAILPDPRGRFQYKIEDFALFWDQPNVKDIERLAHSPSTIPGFHFSLLNFLYGFRLLEDFDVFFCELFALPMWDRLTRLALGEEQGLSVAASTLSITQQLSGSDFPYKTRIEIYKQAADETEHWKRLSERVLPELLSATVAEEEKPELIKAIEHAKQQYLSSLESYDRLMVSHSSSYVGDNYKDLITRMKSVPRESQASAFPSSLLFVAPGEQLLIALLLTKTLKKQSLSFEEQRLKNALASNGCFVNIRLFPSGLDFSLSSVFCEDDFFFFARFFPHAELQAFKDAPFGDFATALSLILNKDLLADFCLGVFLGWDEALPSRGAPHYLRMDLMEMERTAEVQARRLSACDQEQLLRLFAVNRS